MLIASCSRKNRQKEGAYYMKKVIVTLLSLVFLVTGCALSTPDFTTENDVIESKVIEDKSVVEDMVENVEVIDSEGEESDDEITEEEMYIDIEEQVLLEESGIKITAKSLEYGTSSIDLKILIENNSETNATVQVDYSAINNIMMDPMISADIAAGKKVNDTISFSVSDFESYGIEAISYIEISFRCFNSDSWDDIFTSDLIELKTNAYGLYEQTYYTDGALMVDNKGIKVVAKGIDEDWLGPVLKLYIENNTDSVIIVQSRDLSINGFMMNPIFSCEILPGKRAYDEISFVTSDLEENMIKSIDEIEMKLHIFDEESWNSILDTDIINLKFNL